MPRDASAFHSPFQVGQWRVDPATNRITGPQQSGTMRPKDMAVLLHLISRRGEVVSKSELLDAVWPRGFVDQAVLANAVSHLRRAFQDDASQPRVIETILRNGYRFIADVDYEIPAADSIVWVNRSPYRSLQAFEFEHADIFHGRKNAVNEIVDRLHTQADAGRSFVLVIGPSGAGKTSLALAGVLPRLLSSQSPAMTYRHAVFNQGEYQGDVFDGLADCLLKEHAVGRTDGQSPDRSRLAELLRSSPDEGVDEINERIGQFDTADGQRAILLLVVDHLETLFTSSHVDTDMRQQFAGIVYGLARSGRVWIVANMRSDFYPKLIELDAFVSLKKGAGQYDLVAPTLAELGEIIRRPAAAAGLRFGRDDETGRRLDDELQTAAAGHPDALPLLEFTLHELYEHRTDDGLLTWDAYRSLGGLEGCLAERAEKVFNGLDAAEQTALAAVFNSLATTGDGFQSGRFSRRWVPLETFSGGSPERRFVDRFVDARLFTIGLARPGGIVTVAHEALFRCWPRARVCLENSLADLRARTRLVSALERWESSGRSNNFLLAPGPLAEARRLLGNPMLSLSDDERSLVVASLNRQKTTRWVKRGAVVSLAVLAALAIFSAYFANEQRLRAETEADTADQTAQFLSGLFKVSNPGVSLGREITAREILDRGADRIHGDLDHQPEVKAALMNTIATVYMNLGIYDSAGAMLDEALSTRRDVLGDEHPDVTATEKLKGKVLYYQGDYEAARAIYEDVLDAEFRYLGQEHSDISQTLNNLGEVSAALGDLNAAEDYHRRALGMRTRLHGEQHVDVATSLQNLAGIRRQQGANDDAEQKYRLAIAIQEAQRGSHHPEVATGKTNLALLLTDTGQYEEAERLHREALAARRQVLGNEHPHIAHSLHNLAALLFNKGDYETAEPILHESLRLHRQLHGEGHPTVAINRNNLAVALQERGDYAGAEAHFRGAVEIFGTALGEEHPNTAVLASNLAYLLNLKGENEESARIARASLATLEARLPPGHWRTAVTKSILGGALAGLGEYGEAESLLLDNLPIISEAQGERSPKTRDALNRVIALYEARGEAERAAEYRARLD